MGLLLITRFTLLEAVRRRLFLAVIILSILILAAFTILLSVVINVSLGSTDSGTDTQLYLLAGGVIITVLAIWMVYLLSSTLTIVFTANISGEVEAATFAIIVPKPLTRVEIVLGKWLGYALIVCVYTALMFLSFLTIIHWQTGYWPTGAFYALGMLELGMLALLGITTLGSSLVPTIVNGAIALMLFIGAPTASIVQFVVQFLKPTSLQTVQNITTVINLIIPTDALWHGASFFLLPPTADFVTLGLSSQTFNTPFTSGQPVAPALLIWAALYCIALPTLAALRFQRRDL
jgi:ABC-type transport system involved in multi-copper enzyme maturation permease subunit